MEFLAILLGFAAAGLSYCCFASYMQARYNPTGAYLTILGIGLLYAAVPAILGISAGISVAHYFWGKPTWLIVVFAPLGSLALTLGMALAIMFVGRFVLFCGRLAGEAGEQARIADQDGMA